MNMQVKVGDKVIYVAESGAQPVITTVARLTPTGRPAIKEAKGSFRRAYSDGEFWGSRGSWSNERLYLYSDQRLKQQQEIAVTATRCNQEKIATAKQLRADRESLLASQLAQVKEVCGYELPKQTFTILPDGSRFVILNIPLKPDFEEKLFDLLIVRIKDDSSWNGDETKPVGYPTYASAKVASFSSRGGQRGETDEEILWALVRDRYFEYR